MEISTGAVAERVFFSCPNQSAGKRRSRAPRSKHPTQGALRRQRTNDPDANSPMPAGNAAGNELKCAPLDKHHSAIDRYVLPGHIV